MNKPFPQSYWVRPGLLCAGQYPGASVAWERDAKLQGLLDCGIRQVLNLQEVDEKSYGGLPFDPYIPHLQKLAAERGVAVECLRMPIHDASVPTRATMKQILDRIDDSLQRKMPIYLHCW